MFSLCLQRFHDTLNQKYLLTNLGHFCHSSSVTRPRLPLQHLHRPKTCSSQTTRLSVESQRERLLNFALFDQNITKAYGKLTYSLTEESETVKRKFSEHILSQCSLLTGPVVDWVGGLTVVRSTCIFKKEARFQWSGGSSWC